MIFSIVVVLAIFAYAGWTIRRHVMKSKEGKCSACSLSESCAASSCCSTTDSPTASLRPSKS
ncbi:FeoB-associated Cys-rich membrane protein [Gorillibacterium sp. CAU 1737]|uniref:FeoB-associated Cys-rich membrane protein n=1 Tax=Gorillibacterium sp. CAU 1737 TaxID=3140362 RepID=UPI003261CA84